MGRPKRPHRWLIVLIACSGLLLASCGGEPSPSPIASPASGVRGTVIVGGPSGSSSPMAWVSIAAYEGSLDGPPVGFAQADADGRFRIDLKPGTYTVTDLSQAAATQTVVVKPGRYATVELYIDDDRGPRPAARFEEVAAMQLSVYAHDGEISTRTATDREVRCFLTAYAAAEDCGPNAGQAIPPVVAVDIVLRSGRSFHVWGGSDNYTVEYTDEAQTRSAEQRTYWVITGAELDAFRDQVAPAASDPPP